MVLKNVRKRRTKVGYEEVSEKNCTSLGFRQTRISIRKCASKFSVVLLFLFAFAVFNST